MYADDVKKLLRRLAKEDGTEFRARLLGTNGNGDRASALAEAGIRLSEDMHRMLERVSSTAGGSTSSPRLAAAGSVAALGRDEPQNWGTSDKADDVAEWGVWIAVALPKDADPAALRRWCDEVASECRQKSAKDFLRLFLVVNDDDPAQYLCVTAWLTPEGAASFAYGAAYDSARKDLITAAGDGMVTSPRRFTVWSENVSELHQQFPDAIRTASTRIERWRVSPNVSKVAFRHSRFIHQTKVEENCPYFLRGLVGSFDDDPLDFFVSFAYVSRAYGEGCESQDSGPAFIGADPKLYADSDPERSWWRTVRLIPPDAAPATEASMLQGSGPNPRQRAYHGSDASDSSCV